MKRERTGPRYIVSAWYDWAFFLLPPLVSLGIGVAISKTDFTDKPFQLADQNFTGAELLIGSVVHAHLVAVLVRSHLNRDVRTRHPWRFLFVPVLLWAAMVSSAKIAVAATLVATFWDVWHSGAQTFGFARIYDRNEGNPAELGRRFDFWLNQLLYAGPILAGATLVDHLAHVDDLRDVGVTLFAAVPAYATGHQRYLTWIVVTCGSVFLIVYLGYYLWLRSSGYRVSALKVFLVTTTAACSIYAWGFNSFGEAFFVMNLFHAVQYLALVWHAEKATLLRHLRIGRRRAGLACTVYLAAVLGYGVIAELLDSRQRALWAVTIVVSLLHFWYDGFIWSVRRHQV